MKDERTIVTALGLALVLCVAMTAGALATGIDTSSATLPPDGWYVSGGGVSVSYADPALEIILYNIGLQPLVATAVRTPIGNDEMETFDSNLGATVRVDPDGSGSSPLGDPLPLWSPPMTGPIQTITTDRMLSTTGSFDTEIVSMSLSGNIGGTPIIIRESPTEASSGVTDITDLGGGLYHIDSFFDVFTELSVDGGDSWIAADTSVRITLQQSAPLTIPEPASAILALLGVGGLALLRTTRQSTF